MKKLFFLLLGFSFSLSFGQEVFVTLDYVTVHNTDLEKHISIEKSHYKKMHQERVKQGLILGWDMWIIRNNDYGDFTSTLVFAHLRTKEMLAKSGGAPIPGIDQAVSDQIWQDHMSRILKNGTLVMSVKDMFGGQVDDGPARFAVLNYMEVDPVRADEYEKLEMETYKPGHMKSNKAGWGLHKVLNFAGEATPVNYVTADFYKDMSTIYMNRNETPQLTKQNRSSWNQLRKLRKIRQTHIVELLDQVR